jgi:hypothetical protein
MRIDSSGNLLGGVTSPYNGAKFSVNQPTGGQIAAYLYNTGSISFNLTDLISCSGIM